MNHWDYMGVIPYIYIYILVGGLEHVLFLHILGIILPTDFHIFQRGWSHQPDINHVIYPDPMANLPMLFTQRPYRRAHRFQGSIRGRVPITTRPGTDRYPMDLTWLKWLYNMGITQNEPANCFRKHGFLPVSPQLWRIVWSHGRSCRLRPVRPDAPYAVVQGKRKRREQPLESMVQNLLPLGKLVEIIMGSINIYGIPSGKRLRFATFAKWKTAICNREINYFYKISMGHEINSHVKLPEGIYGMRFHCQPKGSC